MGEIKIALVHDFLTVFAGAERVLKSWHEMYPDAPIYTIFTNESVVKEHFPAAKIITSGLQRSAFRSRPWLLLPWMPEAVESYNLKDFDVVLSSSGAFSHGVITGTETTHICYCHSPMRYAWDWHAEYLEEKGITATFGRFMANQTMNRIRLWDAVSAKRVDRWLANSHTVAERIAKYYRAEAEIIFPPVDTDYFDPAKANPPGNGPYAVTVSRLSKNKRVDQIIQAAESLNLRLVVMGDGEEREALEKVSKKTQFTGSVSEEKKRDLLAGASCFLFAAEDDFGIAPVEALALGIPVVALGKGGATEYIEDGKNGFLYAEPTAAELASALKKMLHQGVSWSATEIRQSALKFSTATFQEAIRNVVDHARTA